MLLTRGHGAGAALMQCALVILHVAPTLHVGRQVDPVSDTDVINFELALADIGQIEKRQERLRKGRAKTKEEEAEQQVHMAAVDRHATVQV